MLWRVLMALPLVLSAAGVAGWHYQVAAYFGRIDPAAWEQSHPCPRPPTPEAGPVKVELISTRVVAPAAGMPAEAVSLKANNNLDVIRHGGRVYLAWRTAGSHFAGAEAAINVVSSTDEQTWRFETRIAMGTDLREPRFLSWKGRLMLYVARLGKDPFAFEPRGISVSESDGQGVWTQPKIVGPPGFIVWRVHVLADRALMVGYTGGENMYRFDGKPMQVQVLASTDGYNWQAAFGHNPAVLEGGGSETDFRVLETGDLFAVVRNEAGDQDGYGSKLCTAKAPHLGVWKCVTDPKKYDSPLVFSHSGQTFLIGRRNVTDSGRYDVFSGPRLWRVVRNELSYITTPKRCALWRWDERRGRMAFVMDLPSRGDTCFASVISGEEPDQLIVYDYSSDINGPDLPWAAGQRRETFVYRHVLRFSTAVLATGETTRAVP